MRFGVRTELLAKFKFFYDMMSYQFVVALRSGLLFTFLQHKQFNVSSYVLLEDGGRKFLRYICKYLSIDTSSCPKRQLFVVVVLYNISIVMVLCNISIVMVLCNISIVMVLYNIHILKFLYKIRIVMVLCNISIVMVLYNVHILMFFITSVLKWFCVTSVL